MKIFLIYFPRMIVCWSSVRFSAFAFVFPFSLRTNPVRDEERITYI
ncbi:hypothetical protein LEP1GSC005_1925 [Leptospira santarosai str. ST188]|uniref:Uncharacterized protein n=1 Tax=Leptospira santarosai str. ZUN179 TaxID=1049985 RepID=M6UPB8_9LEPT|nr:hypothetical protein LEP1GSC163_4246 [Leptospira santarosai str. CBC379]EMF89352.1 hypothetical protein LEP1GSC005_1925 [Leptospira santarosai str. ST188]EMO44631.1 hypothetical protein LEP1GSC187_0096 [Leptospira santarosai str. ZUN179]